MPETLDRVGPLPLYQQLAGLLRGEIVAGRLGPGAALPSERKLMARFAVTRATVRSALGLLRAEGLIRAEHGAGAFVRDVAPATRVLDPEELGTVAPPQLEPGARGYRIVIEETVTVVRATADAALAERLQVRPGTAVCRRQILRTEEGRLADWIVASYPWALVRGSRIATPDAGPGGVRARLTELGHPIDALEDWIGARMPTPEERSRLQIHEGVPVLQVTRVAYAGTQPVEVTEQVTPGDRAVLHYQPVPSSR